ncbi:MAG: glycosyltransferase family 2 protein [Elusimicrobia bacterium]|nr:glycosyltransferase family 2 protein [Elusimicrobiota bacterium]
MTASPPSASFSPGGSGIPGGLSAFIIARDEEEDLPGALESLRGLADEVVVLLAEDSADRTGDLAKGAGARVSVRKFDDFASHKNAALALATKEWALSIDADERVTPELREEALQALRAAGPGLGGFEIPFAVFFMGGRLRFGGLGGERHLRLFRRRLGSFTGGALHEGVVVRGQVLGLGARMEHHPYRDLTDYLEKLDRYTSLAAAKRYQAGRRFRWWHHLVLPAEFFLRAVLRLGVLDGRPGLVWAGLSAFHSWLKYVKLAELESKEARP